MDGTVLESLPFDLELPEILRALRIREHSSHVEAVSGLVGQALVIGRPKAVYKIGYIEDKGPDSITVDGLKFTSRVLRVNLDQAQRVFVYICTAGHELEAWTDSQDDMVAHYYADAISERVLRGARMALAQLWQQRYELAETAEMNPGSLPDWPLKEQRVLFTLLGDTQSTIGVELLSSLLMKPRKTVSGFVFPTAETFASCQLCPRTTCPNRRAPYDPDLFDRKYRETA